MEKEVTNQGRVKEYVLKVELIDRASIYQYTETTKPFLKITLSIPKHVPFARGILESTLEIPRFGQQTFPTFESNVPFVLRWMIDAGCVGGCWVEVPAGKWERAKTHNSNCQLEANVAFDQVICHKPEADFARHAPMRILSFDIECAGRKGVFPEPERDPVIQIANMVSVVGHEKPIIKNVFNLKKCTPIVGSEVLCFDQENKLLEEWAKFFRQADPDIVIGYNISNFDFPYLINRAKTLKVDSFPFLGRVQDSRSRVKDTTFSSKAYGTRESKETSMEGRVQFDILQVIQRDFKLRSYSLNAVSAHFLGEQKEDVHHSIITDLFNGDDDDRRRLAVYCLKDAYLPQRLLDRLMIFYNYLEMARVTGIPINYILSRGQSIKVVSQLYRRANESQLLIPCYKSTGATVDDSYEGATVIEPVRGLYKMPIATLDFSSLYPSIMMAHNLCYSTLIRKQDVDKIPSQYVTKTPTGDFFITSDKKKGILPDILERLLAARKKAKQDLAKETDPLKKAILDGRQLALKISANSVYGFTGATVGKLPCFEISASVTSYGRQMIDQTAQLVRKKYTMENDYPADAEIIYGDTDSVMVKFGVETVQEAMELGREAAAYVTQYFKKPINLEFEKVYYPYLLINKKRYAGLFWTKPDKYDKLDAKGIETVRRDNCPLVKNVINTVLQKILIDRDDEGAINYVKSTISDLLQNKIDLSLLVITKSLSKEGAEYGTKQAHVELAERMRKRDLHTAPALGDRVPYVIIKAPKGSRAYEKSEDPLYVLENNLPLDTQYYLENQLKNPLIRIFGPVMKNPQSLLVGDHTRAISQPTPKTGGIVGFTVKKLTCIGCKAPLQSGEMTTCSSCRHREPELYQQHLSNVTQFETQFSKAWTQCQICQGSLHQEVLCSSRDCPIFYMRKKVQKDLNDAQDMLARFNFDW